MTISDKKYSTSALTLYDLMANPTHIWLKTNKTFGWDLTIMDDEGEIVVHEKGIHPYAIEGLAEFCEYFLHSFRKIIEPKECTNVRQL